MEENAAVSASTKPVLPVEIDFRQADVSTRYDDVFQIIAPDEVAEVLWQDGAYQFNCRNLVALRVSVPAPDIIRLRYSPDGHFARDFSYAIDPAFRPGKVTVMLNETENEYVLVSEKLQIVVQKADLRVKFYDLDDRVLCEDAAGFSAKRSVLRGWSELKISKKCHKKEAFYGLGDKTCGANLRGKKFENWCTDAYGFGRQTDPLYRATPIYYALHAGAAYGLFLDNTFRTHFDFDVKKNGETVFWATGGEMNYYFIAGPSLTEAVRGYARLTGRPEMPPLWALGFQQSRWSYCPESRVREVAATFRELQIPCDAIYLDIDYMDGFRCFTWDRAHFPDPAGLISDLKKAGFQTVVMLDPGIKEDPEYHVYREGLAENHFLKTSDGDVAKGPVWPGFCAFPDFSRPETRRWWGDLHEELYNSLNVSGFWNDMNEPAVFHIHHKTLPDHVRHHHEGDPASHRKAHNTYGLTMSRASHEGLRRLRPEKRPFLLTRATFSGGQRHAATWTGDNLATWEHLQLANIQCQRLAVSGFSFCGTDIGGFAGEPDGELFVRWLQLAVFHPLMRIHSMGSHFSGDSAPTTEAADLKIAHEQTPEPDPAATPSNPKSEIPNPKSLRWEQEPWSFGEKWTPLAKKAIELRYALLPYLYSAMRQNALDGTPALRHLIFEDQNDPRLVENERDFLCGEHLLVSPVVQPKIQRQLVPLPKGNWFYFWSGQLCSGETFVTLMADQIPFFVRAGAVLPVYPVMQWTEERPVDELTLYVYFKNGSETSEVYEDAGEGYGHENGQFSQKTFETHGEDNRFVLRQSKMGDLRPTYSRVKIFVVGLPWFAKKCTADGAEMAIKEIRLRERSLYTLTMPADFSEIEWHG